MAYSVMDICITMSLSVIFTLIGCFYVFSCECTYNLSESVDLV